jgi:hypothetical protein
VTGEKKLLKMAGKPLQVGQREVTLHGQAATNRVVTELEARTSLIPELEADPYNRNVIPSHLLLCLPTEVLPRGFPTKILYAP